VVKQNRKRYLFDVVLATITLAFLATLVFDDEIAGWFAEDRDDLVPLLSIETTRSNWDLISCIDDMRVAGLGLQNRRGSRDFLWIDPDGVEREVSSLANEARDTRLDVVEYGDYRVVQFFSDADRKIRDGERAHLSECLGLGSLPSS